MEKPFDQRLTDCMWAAATALCEEAQGAQLAYVQSDEVSVLLVDYHALNTEAWFDNGLQKIVSVSAAVATQAFGRTYREAFPGRGGRPLFDARAFNLPREEVTNYFVWRQQDATRNSIESLGQAHFSHRELHGVSCDEIQEKLHQERGINWNDLPVHQKRGACVRRVSFEAAGAERSRWEVDREPPIFTADRSYVDRHVNPEGQ
jgi:tRNA(His) guanylyltransferase